MALRFRHRILIYVSTALLVAVIAGHLYELAGERRDKQRLPQIGRSIDIGGRSLNIYCSGTGQPAVILESAGGPGYFWTHIQPELANACTSSLPPG